MTEIDENARIRMESAVFRKLLQHLRHRTDAQNVELMGLAGFCRNCLADWYREAAAEHGLELDKDTAREIVYGMPYTEWKERHQAPASEAQLARMDESVKKNAGRGF